MGMSPVESLLKDMATLLPLRLRPAVGEMIYTVATGRFAIQPDGVAWYRRQRQDIANHVSGADG